ncbi:MAG: bifunctional DNA primase/polymerase [Micropruina sp.]|uniref:bifunctional DNA primase/polymerase n=1 Tax=Micropruina sp. TaxID=2737536 RepID=UPI0039E54D68
MSLHDAISAYAAAGWHPLPLPPGKKTPPPSGFSGEHGRDAGPAELADWAQRFPQDANVALRMPEGVLGIDVDGYGDKPGAASLAGLVAQHGPLPPTWVSTSRGSEHGPGSSAIAFYRVPPGRRFPGVLEAGIEAIQRHHRYAVVAPSVHPEGREYRWYAPDGQPSPRPPNFGEIPALPEPWLAGLPADTQGPRGQVSDEAGSAWLGALMAAEAANAEACPVVIDTVLDAPARLNDGTSRHDTMNALVYRLVAQAAAGHRGFAHALPLLRQQWEKLDLDAENAERRAAAEFERMLTGAACKVAAKHPDGPASGDPCRIAADLKAQPGSGAGVPEADPLEGLEAAVFGASDRLQAIRQAARSRLVSPWAVLGCVLARVIAETPVPVVLPPTVGGDASLNLAVALVGPSGVGKSSSDKVARDLLAGAPVGNGALCSAVAVNNRIRPKVLGAGSGEGIVQSFLEWVEIPLPARSPNPGAARPKVWKLRAKPNSLLVVDEIERVAAVNSRSGATLGPILRNALTGDDLSTSNATRERDREVPAMAYRFAAIAGVQPELSGILLDDASAGTPQRWAWLPVTDANAADEDDMPEWPGPLVWLPVLHGEAGTDGRTRVQLPGEARLAIREAHRARLRNLDRGQNLDGHALLTRTKLAAALAFLHGEADVSLELWELAGRVMEVSDRTREDCVQVLARATHERSVARGRQLGVQDQVREDTRAGLLVPRLAALIWQMVQQHNAGERAADAKHEPGEGCTGRCLSRALRRHGGAEHRDAARDEAERHGWIRNAGDDTRTRWVPGPSKPATETVTREVLA